VGSANQMAPLAVETIDGPSAAPMADSVIAPLVVIRPMACRPGSLNHSARSVPATMPAGADPDGSGYRAMDPVAAIRIMNAFPLGVAESTVTQMLPSAPVVANAGTPSPT